MTELLGTARFGPSGSAAGEAHGSDDVDRGRRPRPGERTAVNGTGKPPHELGTRGDGTTVGMRLRCPICRRRIRRNTQIRDCPRSEIRDLGEDLTFQVFIDRDTINETWWTIK